MDIVIVGGGVAALEGAVAARAALPEARIRLLSREQVPPYRRPALSRMVAETVPDGQFYLKRPEFYREQRLELELGREVRTLDPAGRRLELADGGAVSYDRLLIATGSSSFRPPLPGVELPGVMALREFADLEALRARLATGVKQAVILGCGLLGLELAESLLARGVQVTMLECAPRLLPRQLDAEAAAYAESRLRAVPGLKLLFGASATAFLERAGAVSGVRLDSGEELAADLVMLSVGCRVDCTPWRALDCNRGVRVNAQMRTSDPAVCAAGDCAEVEGMLFGLYNPARAMGEVAGNTLAGKEREFHAPGGGAARLAAFGLKLFSIGAIEAPEVRGGVAADGSFRRLFLRDGRIVGGILIGDWAAAAALQNAVTAGATPETAGLNWGEADGRA